MRPAMTSQSMRYIALHAAAATAFGFVLNRFALGMTTEISLMSGAVLGAAAAALAWHQTQR